MFEALIGGVKAKAQNIYLGAKRIVGFQRLEARSCLMKIRF